MKPFIMQAVLLLALVFPVFAEELSPAEVTYTDIEKTLGITPSFFKLYPKSAITGAWEAHKALASKGEIPSKYKELIGLSVSSQIPCTYCVYFHTKAAKKNLASEEEITESVAIAAQTRRWSTVINGAAPDFKLFKKEISLIVKYLKAEEKPEFEKKVGLYADTYNEIISTFGRVPPFLEAYPDYALKGAWEDLKALQLGKTAIPGKYKQLTALAVSAQIPCSYCVEFHTEIAKLNGASEGEIKEAIAIAAETRQWSTVLHGMNVDYDAFKAEIDLIFVAPKKTQ